MKVSLEAGVHDEEGVWAEYKPGVRFKIARAGNSRYLRISDRIDAPFRKKAQQGKLSTEQVITNLCKSMGEGIVRDWEGLETTEGEPLPYSPEAAAAMLRQHPDVRDFITEFSAESENYRREEIEETAKKSVST